MVRPADVKIRKQNLTITKPNKENILVHMSLKFTNKTKRVNISTFGKWDDSMIGDERI